MTFSQPARIPPGGEAVRLVHARARTPQPIARQSSFRPDIEGLRAVAVVLVVLFHASIGPFNGGFIGVDVFFVLSGFLITGLLLRELRETGTISLTMFYARRARRLLPAAIVVLLVTLVASILWLPPLLVPGVSADIAAAAAYVSNLGFAVQATDYFAAAQAPSPVLHYWSLGVEEQFYLFWPAILLLVARSARGRAGGIVTAVLAICAGSFGLSLFLTSASAPWAFFSLPTRAWELGLGALLAVAGPRLRAIPGSIAAVTGWAGLTLIVVAGIVLDQSVPFPGTAALLPAVGAALVVAGGARVLSGRGPAGVLSTRIPRFLGRISYSLYLWHWPVLVIPAIAAGAPLSLSVRLLLVGIAVVLSVATQALVEDPIRRGLLVGTRPRRNLALAGAATMVVALASVAVGAVSATSLRGTATSTTATTNEQSLRSILNAIASGSPDGSTTATAPSAMVTPPTPAAVNRPPGARPRSTAAGPFATPVTSRHGGSGASPTATAPPAATPSASPTPATRIARPPTPPAAVPDNLQPALGAARNDYPASYLDGCHTQEDGHGNTGTCLYGNLGSRTTIALFGDSHALAWFPAMQRFAEKQGWRLLSLTMSTCSPAMIPIWVPAWNRVSWECNQWRERSIQQLMDAHAAVIVVAGTRGFATTDASGSNVLSGDARTSAWQRGMARTLSRLVPASRRVIYLADTPLSRVDPPVCMSQHPDNTLACATSVDDAISQPWLSTESSAAYDADAGFIDPEQWICPTSPCPVVLGNFLIYRDPGHLTATFAQALADELGASILADLRAAGIALG